jgi:tRNA (cytosine34-C5)-methyltransferase
MGGDASPSSSRGHQNALRRAVRGSSTSKTSRLIHKKLGLGRELFDKYYRAQGVCEGGDECGDFERFMRALDAPLPVTFRVHRAHALSEETREALRAGGCAEAPGGVRGAFQAPIDRELGLKRGRPRVREEVLDVFEFATANGCGARQEVVSMLPVVALDVGGTQTQTQTQTTDVRVLDVCAAPGQKTMQLLECVAACGGGSVVHANDAHPGRVKTLTDAIDRHHRDAKETSRLCVTRAFGQDLHMPLYVPSDVDSKGDLKRARREIEQLDSEAAKTNALVELGGYTHVLADVPCSGDGTIRKDPECLTRWSPSIGNALHATQLAVAQRCAQLLKPGGAMVYSTCTFNPIEDEAVVAALVSDQSLALDIEDAFPKECDKIISRPGLHTWRVGDHVEASGVLVGGGSASTAREDDDDDDDDDVTLKWFASFDDASAHKGGRAGDYAPTMWPPSPSKAAALKLDKCRRFLPHDMDTGGFFICKLRKRDDDATRRAFAKCVERELNARLGGDSGSAQDASATNKKRRKMALSAEDARDEALDRLVPVHRVSKDLATVLRARFGPSAHYTVDITRRHVYVGASTPASALLDYECGNTVRLARAGCLLLSPQSWAAKSSSSLDENVWDVRTVDETMRLHVGGVNALMEACADVLRADASGAKPPSRPPAAFVPMLPTELDAVLDMGGDFIAIADLSEPTQNVVKRAGTHPGPVVLCLRKKTGEVVFVAPGVFHARNGVALAPGVSDEDAMRLARSLRTAAGKKKQRTHRK